MINCIFVGIGGFIGSVSRYLIGLLPIHTENNFPIKTLLINVAGAFAISVITTLAAKHKTMDPRIVLMLKTGICGGFTTFSTFAYESTALMQDGQILSALTYMLSSMLLSVLAVFAGQLLV